MARGHINDQITAALISTERAAMRHVDHIRRRLGFHSRTEVAAWAVRRGLAGDDASERSERAAPIRRRPVASR